MLDLFECVDWVPSRYQTVGQDFHASPPTAAPNSVLWVSGLSWNEDLPWLVESLKIVHLSFSRSVLRDPDLYLSNCETRRKEDSLYRWRVLCDLSVSVICTFTLTFVARGLNNTPALRFLRIYLKIGMQSYVFCGKNPEQTRYTPSPIEISGHHKNLTFFWFASSVFLGLYFWIHSLPRYADSFQNRTGSPSSELNHGLFYASKLFCPCLYPFFQWISKNLNLILL